VSIHGIEPHIKAFESAHDDYNKIMLQALADRLAEAFAELFARAGEKRILGLCTRRISNCRRPYKKKNIQV